VPGSTSLDQFQSLRDQRDAAYSAINVKDANDQRANCKDSAPVEVKYRATLATIVFPASAQADLATVLVGSMEVSKLANQCAATGTLDSNAFLAALTTERTAEEKIAVDLGA
jgi:hypothetical protein